MLRTVLTLAILVVGVALGAERCPQWSEPYLHDICNRLVGTLIGSTDILYLVVKNEAAKLEVYQGYIDDSGILLIDNGKKKLLREILPKIYENNDNRFQEGDVTHVMSLFVDATWSILMKRTTKYAFWKVQNNNWQFHQVEQNEHNQAYSPSISKSANSDGTWFVVGEGGLFNLSAKHIRENFEVAQNAFPWMLTEDATRDRLFMHDYELSAHDEKGPTWKIPSEAYGFVSGTKATLIWPGHVTRQGAVAEVLQFELGGNSLTPRYQIKRWFAFRNITLDKFIQIYCEYLEPCEHLDRNRSDNQIMFSSTANQSRGNIERHRPREGDHGATGIGGLSAARAHFPFPHQGARLPLHHLRPGRGRDDAGRRLLLLPSATSKRGQLDHPQVARQGGGGQSGEAVPPGHRGHVHAQRLGQLQSK